MTNVVMMVGEGEYRSHELMRAVADDAERQLGATVTYCTPDILEDMPTFPQHRFAGLDALADADVLVIYTRWRQLPDEQMRYLSEFLERGGSVVGLRTSSHAFRFPPESTWESWNEGFGRDILGSPYINHHGKVSHTEVTPIPGVEHPVLEGVTGEFVSRSWLYRAEQSPDCVPLLMGEPIDTKQTPNPGPVAWARKHANGGRVFYTSLGHPDDFQITEFHRLVLNGIGWCAENEPDRSTGHDIPPLRLHLQTRKGKP